MENGDPLDPDEYLPLKDESGKVTILVPEKMKFTDNKVHVEHFTYRGKDVFICRTALLPDK